MPYGMPKKLGGDTQASDSFMERCIADVTAKGTPKLNAILICKAQYIKSQGGTKK